MLDETADTTEVIGGRPRPHETTILATGNLAGSLFGLERHRAALTLFRDIHQRRRRASGENSLLTLNAEASIAITLHALGDYETARAVNAGLLPRFERVGGKDHSGTGHTHSRLVKNLRALGRHDEAEEVHGGIPKCGSSMPEGGRRALSPRNRGV